MKPVDKGLLDALVYKSMRFISRTWWRSVAGSQKNAW